MCAMTTVNHILAAALCMLIATTPVAAQGKSQAPGQAKKGTAAADSRIPASSTASSPTNTPSSSASSVIYYGSWLDDASIVPTGGAWVGLSTGYWKADALSQIDAPVISAVVGLNSRLQIGGSVPIYHFRDGSGLSESGIGNIAIGRFMFKTFSFHRTDQTFIIFFQRTRNMFWKTHIIIGLTMIV